MEFNVVNKELSVCEVHAKAVVGSSLLLIGDAETITLASLFDTPPESVIFGPFVPLSLR